MEIQEPQLTMNEEEKLVENDTPSDTTESEAQGPDAIGDDTSLKDEGEERLSNTLPVDVQTPESTVSDDICHTQSWLHI